MPSVIEGNDNLASSNHDSYFTDRSRHYVRPSEPDEVNRVRKSFLAIARIEREDSRERDKNFMPEVNR